MFFAVAILKISYHKIQLFIWYFTASQVTDNNTMNREFDNDLLLPQMFYITSCVW